MKKYFLSAVIALTAISCKAKDVDYYHLILSKYNGVCYSVLHKINDLKKTSKKEFDRVEDAFVKLVEGNNDSLIDIYFKTISDKKIDWPPASNLAIQKSVLTSSHEYAKLYVDNDGISEAVIKHTLELRNRLI